MHYLPADIAIHIDPNSIKIRKESFIDKELRESFSDIVYEVTLASGIGYVCFLFEHKSRPDRLTVLQVLKYLVNLWFSHVKEKPGEPLPVVIPLVIYHGMEQWNVPRKLSELIRVPDTALLQYFPDYSFRLMDLYRMNEAEIVGWDGLRLGMLVLKYVFAPDLQDHLETLFRLLGEVLEIDGGQEYWKTTMIYLMTGAPGIDLDKLKETASRTVSPEKGEEIMTIAEKLIRQGEERGIQKGIEKGIAKGLAKGLVKGIYQGKLEAARQSVIEVLEVRFDEIPWDIRENILDINNLEFLEELHKVSIRCENLEAFQNILNQGMKEQ